MAAAVSKLSSIPGQGPRDRRDPFDVEAIWEDLYNRIKDYGLTGMTISAISGIDIALWDIMGRA